MSGSLKERLGAVLQRPRFAADRQPPPQQPPATPPGGSGRLRAPFLKARNRHGTS